MALKEWPCPFVFKDHLCQYKGKDSSCNKSFNDCRKKDNESRFGGVMDYKCSDCGEVKTHHPGCSFYDECADVEAELAAKNKRLAEAEGLLRRTLSLALKGNYIFNFRKGD